MRYLKWVVILILCVLVFTVLTVQRSQISALENKVQSTEVSIDERLAQQDSELTKKNNERMSDTVRILGILDDLIDNDRQFLKVLNIKDANEDLARNNE